MYLARRFLLLALAGVSLLVALFGFFRFLIEFGESPTRYVVQDAAVFAAGVLGLFLCWRSGRKIKALEAAALDEARRFTGSSLEASAQPWKQGLALVFIALMAVASGLLYQAKPEDWRLAACAAVFALLFVLMVPLVASHYRGGRPTLRLDARGLDHAWFGDVPWTAVHGIHLKTQTVRHITIQTLVLGVSDPGRYIARLPWVVRLMHGKWSVPRGRFGSLEIPLKALDKDPLQVVNAAEALRDRVSPKRIAHWHPSLDDASIAITLEMEYLADNPDRLPEAEIVQRMEALAPRLRAQVDKFARRR